MNATSLLPPRAYDTHVDENRSAWVADAPPYEPLPPLGGDTTADVAIIGGGFTGVSTALHLARRFPERRIVLLEARSLATGASGRNGGLVLNWVNGVETSDAEHARKVYDATREGIDLIETTVRELGIDAGFQRDGVLEVFTDPARADAAAKEAEALGAAGIPVRYLGLDELDGKLELRGARGALFDPTAGQINGVKYVRGLRPTLTSLGVEIYENTPVLSIREGSEIELRTTGGEVRAKAIVLATNAYTPLLGYYRFGICPLHSHVIATERLDEETRASLGWRAPVGFNDDLDRIAFGSLTDEGRIVFGGGSNDAYDYLYGSKTRFYGSAERQFDAVRRQLVKYLPGAADLRLEHRWTGTIGLTMSRLCAMGVIGEHQNVYFALGYSGHGVTLANLAGRVLCDLYSGEHDRWRDLPFYRSRLLGIPPEPLRWLGYVLYSKLTGKSPRRRA